METCINCMKPRYIENAYGESLCEECWDEYLVTDRGKVEHFIYIAEGRGNAKLYDADFLGEVVVSWNNNKHLLKLSADEIKELEEVAFHLGLL